MNLQIKNSKQTVMKTSFTTAIFALMILLSTQISAQYSNTSLTGAWYGKGFEPDAYLIFDGNGNIREIGAYGGVVDANVGTYTVTGAGFLSANLKLGDETYPLTGQFITSDSISVGAGISLLKIPDAAALSGTWSGGITNSIYENINITIDTSGSVVNPTSWSGHIFELNGVVVGFFEADQSSECWGRFQFQNCKYESNIITGTVGSDCRDMLGQASLTREITTILNISAGGLSGALGEQDKASVTEIKLTGTIDARDFKSMRDEMPNLATVDLIDVTIAEYTGLGGTYGTSSNNYPANSIPRNAFYKQGGNLTLSEISFPESLTQISRSAFYECRSLSSVEIPSSVTDIGQGSFYNCSSLSTLIIDFPSSLVSIGNYAFGHCWQLFQSIEIAEGVVSIGEVAFSGSYLQVNVNHNNPNYSSLNGILFDKNKTRIIYVPPTLMGEIEIPSTVTTIETGAFFHCVEITDVLIPSSVKKIGDYAFEYCSGLTSLNILANVDSIGKEAFSGCESLSAVFVYNFVPINLTASDSVFKKVNLENCVLWVPTGSKSAYENANQWKDFKQIEEFECDLHNGLIAYYPFNGNADDESENENHGTVFGATLSADRFNNPNCAYSFNGVDDYISIDKIIDNIYLCESYTVTGWFKIGNSQKGTIFSINREPGLVELQNLSHIIWDNSFVYYSDDMKEVEYQYPDINTSEWHFFHLIFVKDSISKLCLDNQVVTTACKNSLNIPPDGRASIGQEWDNGFDGSNYFTITSDFFNGKIDDIRIYSRILNQFEVNALLKNTTTGVFQNEKAGVKVYPNPATDYINIDCKENDVIEIYNIGGTLMKSLKSAGQKSTINVSTFPNGIYLVKLSNGSGIATNKFIKY